MKQQILISCSATLLASAIAACLFPAHAADAHIAGTTSGNSTHNDGTPAQTSTTGRKSKTGSGQALPAAPTEKDAVNLNSVSVTGQLASLRRAQEIKRDASGIVDSVSAEEAGKFPDQNVADALQRVPGVSVDRSGGESNQITVRGFGPTFVNVLLNGRTMASSANNRAFNFDVMPSSVISTAIVNKTASAKLEEGGIGGTVNIVTARPFDFKGLHATASVAGVYDRLGSGSGNSATPKFSAMVGNTNADNTFGWLASVMYYKRDHSEQSVNTSGWIPGLDYSNINPAYTNISIPQTLQGQALDETRTRRSFNGSIDWIPFENFTVKADTFLSNYRTDSKYHAFGLFANTSDIQSLTADANGTALSYTRFNTGVLANDYIMESNPADEYNEQTGLNLAYAFSNATKLSLDSSYSKAWNKQSANGYFIVLGTRNVGVNPVFTNNGADLLPSTTGIISSTDPSDLRAHYFGLGGQSPNVSDRVMQNRLHLSHSFVDGLLSQLDFGVEHTEQRKTQSNYYTPNAVGCSEYCGYVAHVPASAVGAYVYHAGNLVDGVSPGFPTQWLGYDVNKLLQYLASPAAYGQLPNAAAYEAALAANGGGYTARLDPNSYSQITERTNSAYGEASFDGYMGDKHWTANVGLRYSRTETQSVANSVPILAIKVNPLDTSNAIPTFGPLAPVEAKGRYSQWLPSADFKMNLRDDLIVRAAVSKTMTRPDLSNLSAASNYNFRPQDQTVSTGNVNLKPYISTNYDASIEWYISNDSYIALDGFEKKVKNFTTLVTTRTDILGFPFLLTKPVNLNDATIKGAEFTFNYQFHQLPAPFDGLGTAFNYTYVTSSTSVNGTSSTGKFAVPGIGNSSNLSLYYERGPVQTRIAYNWRAKYLSTIAGDQSQPTTVKPYGEVDFSASYDISKHIAVFANATNLLNETIFRYQVFPNRPSYAEKDGRTFVVGVRASL